MGQRTFIARHNTLGALKNTTLILLTTKRPSVHRRPLPLIGALVGPHLLDVVMQRVLIQHHIAHICKYSDFILRGYHDSFIIKLRCTPKSDFPSLSKVDEFYLHGIVLYKHSERSTRHFNIGFLHILQGPREVERILVD